MRSSNSKKNKYKISFSPKWNYTVDVRHDNVVELKKLLCERVQKEVDVCAKSKQQTCP